MMTDLRASGGVQTGVKNLASPERRITVTCTLSTSHVLDVSSRNVTAGFDKTFFKVVIDGNTENRHQLIDFDIVDNWNSFSDPSLKPTYREGIQKLVYYIFIKAAGFMPKI